MNKCEIDPNKECPQKAGIRIVGAGIVACSSKSYMACCKCRKQLKQASKLTKQTQT
jgi:hypothetical protein